MSEQRESKELERRLQRQLLIRIGRLAQAMEKFNIAGYIDMLNSPRRYLLVNFIGGVARGVGFALGATLLAALVLFFLRRLVMLNLPVIGDFIAELIRIVNRQL